MDFQKEMRGFYMHSVCLPEKVTEQFSGLSGEVLELKRKGGDTWHVGLIRSGCKLILQPGWSSFASANSISQNDILLFKFMGKSKFEVHVFDSNGCEILSDPKELVNTTKGGSLKSDNMHAEESKKVQIKIPARKGSMKNLCNIKLKRLLNGSGGGCYNTGERAKLCKELKKEMGQNQSYPAGEETSNCLAPGKCLALNNEVIFWSGKGALSAEQRRRAKKLAIKVQASNPAFLKVMTAHSLISNVGINVPTKFSAEHLPKKTQDVVLCRPKKEMTWLVKFYYRKKVQTFEGTPWRKFVLGNGLQEGDMCLFEMVKAASEIVFLVRISRATSGH